MRRVNIENDLRASLHNNPFSMLEAVTLNDIEPQSDDDDVDERDPVAVDGAVAADAKRRCVDDDADADDDDGLGSVEMLGDYDRNDNHEPIYDDDLSSGELLDEAAAATDAERAAEAAAETARRERQLRADHELVAREWAARMRVEQAMHEAEVRERAASLVGEESRDGATKFGDDFATG